MAIQKVADEVVIEKLMEIFRSVGYDGASMTELAAATGVKIGSLYHRYPGGKQAMAHAVLEHIADLNDSMIIEVFFSSEPADDRLSMALRSINDFYDGGKIACILRALSHGADAGLFRNQIAAIFQNCVIAFTHLAADFGHDMKTSIRLAESTMARIQGSLILAQTFQKPDLFEATLNEVRFAFYK
jgi:TetR/AcrR family transcriptional repressor of lmrAB and yxaGH operons